jgi:hypothetical protein
MCVCRGGGDNFVERFALFFESRHFLASANQQIAVKGELGFVVNSAVAWNDDPLPLSFNSKIENKRRGP